MNVRKLLKSLHSSLPSGLRQAATNGYRFAFARLYERKVQGLKVRHELLQQTSSDLFVLRDGLAFQLASNSSEALECFCYSIPTMVEEMNCFLDSARGLRSFVDVGAFHGAFSLAFAALNPGACVLALEPFPDAFKALTSNGELNEGFKIKPLMQAAGRELGTIRMKQEWEHFVVIDPKDNKEENFFTVPVVPLDILAQQQNVWPEIIKVDVEGFESDVLAGAKECLKRCRVVHLEVHPRELKGRNVETGRFLQELGNYGFEIFFTNGKRVHANSLPEETFRVVLIRRIHG